MLSIHKEALKRKPKLIRYYQPGTRGFEDFLASQTEHNFRVRDRAVTVAAPVISKPVRTIPTETPVPRTPDIADLRFHKWGSLYVTVSNQHLDGQDPVLDPAFAHTITDGYAKIKALLTAYQAAFPSDTNARGVLAVFGGSYDENVIFDTTNIDVYGIGFPTITADAIAGPAGTLSSVVTIAAACESMVFDGFRIINKSVVHAMPEIQNFWNAIGLTVEEGNETGKSTSSIQLKNLILEGGGTQAYIQRRIYADNVTSESFDNYDNLSAQEASVIERYCTGNGSTIEPQRGWSQWKNCHFHGQSTYDPFSGEPSTIRRGKAFAAWALAADLTSWIPNAASMGIHTDPLGGDANHFYLRTGVYFENCNFDGWTQNIGWAWEYDSCKGIQGKWNNDTGAGATHHFMVCNSDAIGNAYTWMSGGTEIEVNYLILCTDVSMTPGVATCYAWLRNFTQACPSFTIGGTAMNTTNAATKCWGLHASTHLQFFATPVGAADSAVLVNCSTSVANVINTNAGVPIAGIPKAMMRQGYQNLVI